MGELQEGHFTSGSGIGSATSGLVDSRSSTLNGGGGGAAASGLSGIANTWPHVHLTLRPTSAAFQGNRF